MVAHYLLANTIVFLTENSNPSIYNNVWFANNNIFQFNEILQDSVFSNRYVNIVTTELSITIVPTNITIDLKKPNNAENLIEKHIRPFLSKIYQTVRAIGINFIWKVCDEERDIYTLSKDLFGGRNTCLSSVFMKDDVTFGSYMSQSYDDAIRMKLDVKPVRFTDIETGMIASFNFHYNMSSNQELNISQLEKWSEISKKAEEIVCLMK